jgi:flavin reductase (DIM6/NTAB) family NADH-FMN oxidoreductase RutF
MVDVQRFRAIMGSFPAGVVVVTAVDADGEPRGLTGTAMCSVSADPPLLLICVDRSSNTLPALRHSRAFVVNILSSDAEHISQRFASKDKRKFDGVPWRPSEIADGAPIVEEHCTAYAECRCVEEIEAGDHIVFIARVDGGDVMAGGAPLVFRRGIYRAWSALPATRGETVELPV